MNRILVSLLALPVVIVIGIALAALAAHHEKADTTTENDRQ